MNHELARNPVVLISAGIAIVLFSIYAALYAIALDVDMIRVDGTVDSAKYVTVERPGIIFTGYSVELSVDYSYWYDGNIYHSDRYYDRESPISWFNGVRRSRYLGSYRVGEKVDVWVDPSEPSHSVLIHNDLDFLFAVPGFVLGAFLIVGGIRHIMHQDNLSDIDCDD